MWKNFMSETEYGTIINDPCCKSLEDFWNLQACFIMSLPYVTCEERNSILGNILSDDGGNLGCYISDAESYKSDSLNLGDEMPDCSDDSHHLIVTGNSPVEIEIIRDSSRVILRI